VFVFGIDFSNKSCGNTHAEWEIDIRNRGVHGLDFQSFQSGVLLPTGSGVRFPYKAGAGLDFDFVFVEEPLMVLCLTYLGIPYLCN